MTNQNNSAESNPNNDIEFDISGLESDIDLHVAKEFTEYLDLSEETDKLKVVSDIDGQVDLHELSFNVGSEVVQMPRSEVNSTLVTISQNSMQTILDAGTDEEKTALGAVMFALTHDLAVVHKKRVLADQPDRETKGFDLAKAQQSMNASPAPAVYGNEAGVQQFLSSGSPLAQDILTKGIQEQSVQVTGMILPDLMRETNKYIDAKNTTEVGDEATDEEVNNAELAREQMSVFDKDWDFLFDKKKWNPEKTKLAAKLGIGGGLAILAGILGFKMVKNAVSPKEKPKTRWGRTWQSITSTVKGIAGAAGMTFAGYVGYKYFSKQDLPVGDISNRVITAPDKDELINAADSLDDIRYKIYNRTRGSINKFYAQQIGYTEDVGIQGQADMNGEYETDDMNEKVGVGELYFFGETHSSVDDLLSNTELVKKIMKKETLGAVIYLAKKFPGSLDRLKAFLTPIFKLTNFFPSLQEVSSLDTILKLMEDLENSEEAMGRLEKSMRRWFKWRNYLLYQEDNVSYKIASEYLTKNDRKFGKMDQDEKHDYLLEKLKDPAFVKSNVKPTLQKEFLAARPEKALQYLGKMKLLDNLSPIDVQLKETLEETKLEYQELVGYDADSKRSRLAEIAQSSEISASDKEEFDGILDEFEDVLGDFSEEGLLVKAFPLLDIFDIDDDTESTIAETLGMNNYHEAMVRKIMALKKSKKITPSDVAQIQSEIKNFYRMKQELQIGTFYTVEHLDGLEGVGLRVTNAFAQLGESLGLLGSHFSHAVKAYGDPNQDLDWKRIKEGGAIAGGMTVSLLGITFPGLIIKKTLGMTLKTGAYLPKHAALGAGRRLFPTYVYGKYADNINLFKKRLLNGRLSIDQGIEIATKLGKKHPAWKISNNLIASEKQLFLRMDNSITDTQIALLKKYKGQPDVLNLLFDKTYTGSKILVNQRLSAHNFQYEFDVVKFEQLKNIDQSLGQMKGSQKVMFEEMLKHTKDLDVASAMINSGKKGGMYSELFKQIKSVDTLMTPEKFGKYLAKYGKGRNVDVLDMIDFIKTQKAAGAITDSSRFIKNTIKYRDKGVVSRSKEALNAGRLSGKLDSIAILPNQLKALRKTWKATIESLKNSPKASKIVKVLEDMLKVPNNKVMQKASKYLSDLPAVGRMLFRGLSFVGVAVGGFEMYSTNSELKILDELMLNPKKKALMEKKLKEQGILTTAEGVVALVSSALVKAPPYGTLLAFALEGAMAGAWELSNAYYDTLGEYMKSYKEYVRESKVEVMNGLVGVMAGESGIDKGWKDYSTRGREWMKDNPLNFKETFGDTSNDAIKALLRLDEVGYDNQLAHYGFLLEKEETKHIAREYYDKSEGLQTSFDSYKAFTTAVMKDKNRADINMNIRYEQLLDNLPTTTDGKELDLQSPEVKEHLKKKTIMQYLNGSLDATRSTGQEQLVQNFNADTINTFDQRQRYSSSESSSFDGSKIEGLQENGGISLPMELMLYQVAVEIHGYTIQPTQAALKATYTEAKAGEHGFYFDGDILKVNNQGGLIFNGGTRVPDFDIDKGFGIDSGKESFKKMITELVEAGIHEGDMIDTPSNSGESVLSREYGRNFLRIVTNIYDALGGDESDESTNRKRFLEEGILDYARAHTPDRASASPMDEIIGSYHGLGSMGKGLYKYENGVYRVKTSNKEERLQEVLDKNSFGVDLEENDKMLVMN